MAARIQNMTEGKPLKLILAFSLPLMIGNVFQQLYTVVDTMVVGQAILDVELQVTTALATLLSVSTLIPFSSVPKGRL